MCELDSSAGQIQSMGIEEIYQQRCQLMLIMSQAYLQGRPLGAYRRQAMGSNADYMLARFKALPSNSGAVVPPQSLHPEPHFQEQYRLLLSVMNKAVAQGHPMGTYRTMAMEKTCAFLLAGTQQARCREDYPFLKVA